ncbi:hypothetical protein [Sphingosinicella sp. LY1275]|uniref:hypothetical protein n=1 Tax=Sphingosinicella sp. LY1275 TaxID=3095379 RepID=UPI002ADEE96F|nr:hypothetical protein [Sphingosinicella sp. LY1275]MEA1013460.1 hypothetical protein [Sphingosinicella sp. LY1275]
MLKIMTVPTLAALTVAGVALGVHFGHAAIAEINPAYYSEPESRFFADLSPYRSPEWAQSEPRQAVLDFSEGLGPGCVKCPAYPEEYVPQHDPAVDAYVAGSWQSPAYEPVQYAVYEAPDPVADPELAAVERYAAAPVSEEEEAVAVAPPVEVVAAEGAPVGM